MKRRSFLSRLSQSVAGVVLASSIEVFAWISPPSNKPVEDYKEQETDHMSKTVAAFSAWWMHQKEPSGEEFDVKDAALTERLRLLQLEEYGEESFSRSIAGDKIYREVDNFVAEPVRPTANGVMSHFQRDWRKS